MTHKCAACGKEQNEHELLQMPLGYYVCVDVEECIAEFSGWSQPAEPVSPVEIVG